MERMIKAVPLLYIYYPSRMLNQWISGDGWRTGSGPLPGVIKLLLPEKRYLGTRLWNQNLVALQKSLPVFCFRLSPPFPLNRSSFISAWPSHGVVFSMCCEYDNSLRHLGHASSSLAKTCFGGEWARVHNPERFVRWRPQIRPEQITWRDILVDHKWVVYTHRREVGTIVRQLGSQRRCFRWPRASVSN